MESKTKLQISKAMKAAGITGELKGKGHEWEVEVSDEKTMRKFCKNVCSAGGYRTGYGSWVLTANYQSQGDFNDRGSAWHY